jgi:lambda family phage portal protein
MKLEPLDLSEARAAMLKAREPLRPRASATEAGKMDRLTFDWAFRILSTNQEIGLDQDRIVSRSRQLANDDTTMAKFLATIWKNVFGPDGIRLQSKVMLQRGNRPNTVVNGIIEGAWKEWSRKENCTLDKRMSWTQLQRAVCRTVAIDGECFLRKVKTRTNPFGFCLQIINADRVDRTYGRNSPQILGNGNFLFMGVECDPNTGAVAAYHVFNRHPAEAGSGPRQRIRIPAEEIIHVYLPVRDNQWRGFPWALPAMWRMNMLKGYEEAEVVAARVHACQMGFITRNIDPDAAYTGQGGDPGRDYKSDQNIPMEAGAFGQLAPGESIEKFDPQHPNSAYPSFVKEAKLGIAAGLDVAYMTLTGDVGAANYSSARVALLDERDTWEGLQGFYIEDLCQPVFEAWLEMAFLTYLRKSLPGGDWRSYSQTEWHPRSFPWVDPLKDTEALIAKWSNKFTTLHRILASEGYDFEETVQEWADEQKRAKELGVDLTPQTKTPNQVLTESDATPPVVGKPGKEGTAPQGESLVRYVMSAAK